MSIHLERKDLINAQQMEVAVNGPDGATHRQAAMLRSTRWANIGYSEASSLNSNQTSTRL